MKTADWIALFLDQDRRHGKRVFALAELANLAGNADTESVRVNMARLAARHLVERYCHGCYGLQGLGRVEDVLPLLDPTAYITGLSVLFAEGFVTQAPAIVTCFTRQRHRQTRPIVCGSTLQFFTVGPAVYAYPGTIRAAAPQALYDFVYQARRQGAGVRGVVTLRHRDRLRDLTRAAEFARYPAVVRAEVTRLIGSDK